MLVQQHQVPTHKTGGPERGSTVSQEALSHISAYLLETCLMTLEGTSVSDTDEQKSICKKYVFKCVFLRSSLARVPSTNIKRGRGL